MNKYQQDKFFDYKESVVDKLVENYKVYFRTAEVAALDLKAHIALGFKEKWTPEKTAESLMETIRKVYLKQEQLP